MPPLDRVRHSRLDCPPILPAFPVTTIRVLIFHTHAGNGGTEEISRLLQVGLAARGYAVEELSFVRATSFRDPATDNSAAVLPQKLGLMAYGRMARFAFSEIRRRRPDVILGLQWGGNMLGAIAALFAGSPLMIANQFTPMEFVPAGARWIDRLQGACGAFSRIVVNSRAVEDGYAAYPGRYRNRLVRIDHGFAQKTSALSAAQARDAFGLPLGVTLLGSVGRLTRQKNFEAAVRLLTRNAGWHLALAGHGEEEERLRTLAASLGCADRLHMPGEIHPDRVGDFLAALDVFVFPTAAETFGLAVVEAAEAGVPVVAADLPVLREVLAVNGQACALFADPEDTAGFAQAVSRLLGDESLRRQLTEPGRCLTRRYAVEKMIDGYDRLIKAALEERQ